MLGKRVALSIPLLAALFFLAVTPSFSFAAKSSDRTTYEKRVAAFERLKGDSRARRYRDRWESVISGFDSFIRSYPSSKYIDDAAYNRAAAHLELFRVSRISPDLAAARKAYDGFINDFPDSPHMDKALYESGRIYLRLGDKDNAARRFFAVANYHSDSPLADDSRRRLKTLPRVEPETKGSESIKGLHQVKDIRYWSDASTTRIVIQLEDDFTFEDHMIRKPDRLYFDIDKAFINSPLKDAPIEVQNGMLKRIRTSQYDADTVRVVLDLENVVDFHASKLPDPPRLVVDVAGPGADACPPDETGGEMAGGGRAGGDSGHGRTPEDDNRPIPLARQLGLCARTIVIDPGHGGKDSGAVGRSGLKEKDVVLDIGIRLRALLNEKMGCKVIMTRDADRFIELDERPYIARKNGADIFISIHANASRNRRARGIETYRLNTTKKRSVMEVAARENMTTEQKMSDLVDIVTDILTDSTRDESMELADNVQSNIVDQLSEKYSGIKDKKVKEGPFLVLYGTKCASVLTEVGFISNSDEEKLLKSSSYRQRVAEAIFEGIKEYISELKVAAYSPTAYAN